MSRMFSVPRRRLNFVDLYANFVAGADPYRVWYAANFDVALPWTKIIECNACGFVDPAVSRDMIESQQTNGKYVRIVFDPRTYGITDTVPFWLMVSRVVGAEVFSPPTLILPEDAHHGVGIVILAGAAPVAAPLQLDLPRLMSDIRISNDDGAAGNLMYVSTVPSGPVFTIWPTADVGVTALTLKATEGTLIVQADTADVAFTATCTLSFPK